MVKVRWLPLLVLFISLLALVSCSRSGEAELAPDADPASLPELTGSYIVHGFDPLGTEYSGHLTITAGDSPATYRLQWIITGIVQEGRGSLQGNQLIVEWHNLESLDADSRGSGLYTITEKGQLYGTRTVEGAEGEGTETAFPNP